MLRRLLVRSVFLSVYFFSPVCAAATITVDPAGGGNFKNIQSAINAARNGDTVVVKPSEYRIRSSITFRGKRITVKGENGPAETVIRVVAEVTPVVIFENGEGADSLLEGFTLTGAAGNGVPSTGVFCTRSSSPTLRSCTITGNTSDGGGAVSCQENSSPTLRGCTITGNSAVAAIWSDDSSPILINCVVWANPGGSILTIGGDGPQVLYSCIEGAEVWPGEGNINEDPLFCGWESAEVAVADEGGFDEALRASSFSLKLSPQSPCLGAGVDGARMGAPTGICEAAGEPSRLIRLSPGVYRMAGLSLAHNVSIEGAGQGQTVLEGRVLGLRTGARLSRVTVRGGTCEGIQVSRGEAPSIEDSTVTGSQFAGVRCHDSVAATNVNGDATVNISDPVRLLSFLFEGGLPPVAPFPVCGPGELVTDEALGCESPVLGCP